MSSKYSNQRVAGKEHIPLYPKGFIAVRIIQLIIALVCLGLCAFGVTYFVFAGDALMLFTAVATLITSIYCLVAHYGPPKAFNYWAILGLDIFLVIFWLVSFGILAAQVASFFVLYDDYNDYNDYYNYYGYDGYDSAVITYVACLAAAAGLGGVQFILYIVSLSIHGVMLHRHRKAGLKAMPGSSPSTNSPPHAAAVSVGGEKFQIQPQNPQVNPTPGSPPPPHQQMYAPPQQQNFYPQQAPSPLSA
ncbi:hypothetical protein F5X99DRAFT_74065 [Biscogniauxia marginata]|nr:hypothetical protein F5X99DRAFT_74065 [Biscogniauxia marginata]